MNFGIWSYLVSILLFGGTVILLEYFLFKKRLQGTKKVLACVMCAMAVFGILGEWIAFRLDIWGYYKGKILGIFVGSTLESVVFVISITLCVAFPTLYFLKKMDEKYDK